ncbi:MAG: hypothetical protein QNJ33_12305 [Crocosphaera sp.]|nr:hypothetical protein [Crocosphaera sp.]
MKELPLFDDSENFQSSNNFYLGTRDWEVDCQKKVFCNTPRPPNNESSQDSKKVFCNNTNRSEKAVTEYKPRGTAGHTKKYFRFTYRSGKRVKHIHIKGGNTESQLAIKRKNLVEAWIREKIPLEKIIAWIKEW